jgi:predicted nucleic acid-binding protein
MKRYWDSSALVEALHHSNVEEKALEPDQTTRPHALAETFSTLTGGRLGFKYLPDDAADLIEELTGNFQFVELTPGEIKAALRAAQAHGVRGGRVHDWIHAVAAQKSGSKVLLTDNLSDFEGLQNGFRVVSPFD